MQILSFANNYGTTQKSLHLFQTDNPASIAHSEVVMNENPLNIPRVPPTLPRRDIHEMIKYSSLIVLKST